MTVPDTQGMVCACRLQAVLLARLLMPQPPQEDQPPPVVGDDELQPVDQEMIESPPPPPPAATMQQQEQHPHQHQHQQQQQRRRQIPLRPPTAAPLSIRTCSAQPLLLPIDSPVLREDALGAPAATFSAHGCEWGVTLRPLSIDACNSDGEPNRSALAVTLELLSAPTGACALCIPPNNNHHHCAQRVRRW